MKSAPLRKALIAILATMVILLSIALALPSEEPSDRPWSEGLSAQATEVPLTAAWALLREDIDGRRAAIAADTVFVQTPLDDEEAESTEDDVADPNTLRYETIKARLPFPAHEVVALMTSQSAVDLEIHSNPKYVSWIDRAIALFPLILIIAIVVFLVRRGAGRSFGLTPAYEVIEQEHLKETLDDVAGIDTARNDIHEIIGFLRDPGQAAALGGRLPKGALFAGPPGTGKTLLARAMAKEAGVDFISISASSVNQMFVGVGAMKLRKAFSEARKRAPCIVFIDEIDAMGKARSGGGYGSAASDEKETTLNALLVELDGFNSRDGVFLIAATNRPEILDPALTRSGRIDRKVTIDQPDLEARKAILAVHARKTKIHPGLDLDALAASLIGFSGADLATLANEAALIAAGKGHDLVQLEDYEAARDQMILGRTGSARRLPEIDRRLTAIHEAGHALIAATSPHADPIEKATIVPRGQALGFVMQSPERDLSFETHARLMTRIRVAVAGREAERLVFGADDITSGAASDIVAATRVAKAMALQYGMSTFGFVAFDPQDPALFDPENPPIRQIQAIIAQAQAEVAEKLSQDREILIKLADQLEARETLTGKEIAEIVGR